MPDFQSFNYAALQPQDNGRNLFEALQQGLQTGGMPFQMRRQAESVDLANALKRMQIQNEPENERLKQALMQEQIQQIQNPRPTEFEQKMKLLQQYLGGQNPLANDQNGQPQNPNGIPQAPQNADKLRDIFIKNLLGLPLETEEEKFNRSLKEYEAKKNIDRRYQNTEDKYNKDLQLYEDKKKIDQLYQKTTDENADTLATKTANQKRLRAVHSLMPMLGNLVNYENPENFSLSPFSSTQSNVKRYKDLTTLPIESIMRGFDWQAVEKNIEKAENLVKIGAGENKQDYKKRIIKLSNDILREVKDLPGGEKIFESLPKAKIVYKNKFYEVPLNEVETFLDTYKGSKFYEK